MTTAEAVSYVGRHALRIDGVLAERAVLRGVEHADPSARYEAQ